MSKLTTLPRAIARLAFCALIGLLSACGGGGSGSSDGDAALMIVLNQGNVQLFDQTQAVSGTNPFTVDTIVSGSDWTSFSSARIDPASGLRSKVRTPRLVYIKGGRIYSVNTSRGANHAPRQISSINDACGLRSFAFDEAIVDHSWLRVQRGNCNTELETFVRLDTPASGGGVDRPSNSGLLLPLNGSSGELVGFIVRIDSDVFLVDPNLDDLLPVSGPQPVGTCDENGISDSVRAYFHCFDGVETSYLYRYDIATRTISLVYGAEGVTGQIEFLLAMDDGQVYFATGDAMGTNESLGRVMALAHGGTTPRALTNGVPGSLSLQRHTDNRVIFLSEADGGEDSRYLLHAVSKSATSATPATLYDGVGRYPFILSADAGGLLHVNLLSLTGSDNSMALRVHEDGSGPQFFENAQWGGGNREDGFRAFPFNGWSYAGLVKLTETGSGVSVHTLDPASGAERLFIDLIGDARLNPSATTPSSGLDRYVGIRRLWPRDSGGIQRSYVFDAGVVGSVQAMDGMVSGGGGN